MTTGKSKAVRQLERLIGGPLTLGTLLEAIRVGEEETLAAFAERLGVSRAHLCDIEKGRRMASPARAARWARELGYGERDFVRYALQDIVRNEGLQYRVQLDDAV